MELNRKFNVGDIVYKLCMQELYTEINELEIHSITCITDEFIKELILKHTKMYIITHKEVLHSYPLTHTTQFQVVSNMDDFYVSNINVLFKGRAIEVVDGKYKYALDSHAFDIGMSHIIENQKVDDFSNATQRFWREILESYTFWKKYVKRILLATYYKKHHMKCIGILNSSSLHICYVDEINLNSVMVETGDASTQRIRLPIYSNDYYLEIYNDENIDKSVNILKSCIG